MPRSFALCLHQGDQVAVMASMGEAGQPCDVYLPEGMRSLQLVDAVPFGHKVAIEPVEADQQVFKYGQPIGIAIQLIAPGSHVHTHNLAGLRCDSKESSR